MPAPRSPAAPPAPPSSALLWRFILVTGLIGLVIVVVSALGHLVVASFFMLLVLVVGVLSARVAATVGSPAIFAPLAWLPLWGIPAVVVPMSAYADDDLTESLTILFVLGGSLVTIVAAMIGALIGTVGGIGRRRHRRDGPHAGAARERRGEPGSGDPGRAPFMDA